MACPFFVPLRDCKRRLLAASFALATRRGMDRKLRRFRAGTAGLRQSYPGILQSWLRNRVSASSAEPRLGCGSFFGGPREPRAGHDLLLSANLAHAPIEHGKLTFDLAREAWLNAHHEPANSPTSGQLSSPIAPGKVRRSSETVTMKRLVDKLTRYDRHDYDRPRRQSEINTSPAGARIDLGNDRDRLPNDANPLNALLGGRLMHWIDLAGAMAAHRHSRAYVVTASIDHLDFLVPVRVGDLVILRSSVNRVFHTSMEVGVKVWVENYRSEAEPARKLRLSDICRHRCSGKQNRRCRRSIPETEDEKRRYEGAARRREMRRAESARKKKARELVRLRILVRSVTNQRLRPVKLDGSHATWQP